MSSASDTPLDYLWPVRSHCNLEALAKIKREKEVWLSQEKHPYQSYLDVIGDLPRPHALAATCDFSSGTVKIGREDEMDASNRALLEEKLQQFIPWRKGPFELFGIELDAEWRSDLKWQRLLPHLDSLQDQLVLDIGCNNGHYMFQMAALGARMVLGIDPGPHNYFQFQLMQSYARVPSLHFELFQQEHLLHFDRLFHTIFSMGVIYHHRDPIGQLELIHKALRPGGQLILETIGIPGTSPQALFPEKTYAKMNNVWFIPTESCAINWLKKARFTDIKVISMIPTTSDEQRSTRWCPPPRQSLKDFLDPQDSQKTIEGYPAPWRLCLSARKK